MEKECGFEINELSGNCCEPVSFLFWKQLPLKKQPSVINAERIFKISTIPPFVYHSVCLPSCALIVSDLSVLCSFILTQIDIYLSTVPDRGLHTQ